MSANNETGHLDASALPEPRKVGKPSDGTETRADSLDQSVELKEKDEKDEKDEKLIQMLKNAPIKGPDPLIGTTLGDRFRVEDVLGAGGMSVVYRATQLVVDRPVAIKTLHIRLHSQQGATERFQREIKTLCKLSHPNIVTVYDCLFSEAGQPFVIMDMLKGRSLDELIKSDGPMAPMRAQKIFLQICKGLEHAHRNNVIHRDLKPANVMLLDDSEDFVKVVDFGLAKIGEEEFKLTRSGEVWGSPIYMSPEQCRAQACDERSDVYSLGVLMYETLTGKPPFSAGNLYEIYKGHITEAPKSFSQVNLSAQIPLAFERLVLRALAKDPSERFQSMTELKEELRTLYAGNYDDSGGPSGNKAADSSANAGSTGVPASARKPSSLAEYQADIQKNTAPQKSYSKAGLFAVITLLVACVAGFGYYNYATVVNNVGQQQSSAPGMSMPNNRDKAPDAVTISKPATTQTPAPDRSTPMTTQQDALAHGHSQAVRKVGRAQEHRDHLRPELTIGTAARKVENAAVKHATNQAIHQSSAAPAADQWAALRAERGKE